MELGYDKTSKRLNDSYIEEFEANRLTLLELYKISLDYNSQVFREVESKINLLSILGYLLLVISSIIILVGTGGMIYIVTFIFGKINVITDLIPRIDKEELQFFHTKYNELKTKIKSNIDDDNRHSYVTSHPLRLFHQIDVFKQANVKKGGKKNKIISKVKSRSGKMNKTKIIFWIVSFLSIIGFIFPIGLQTYILENRLSEYKNLTFTYQLCTLISSNAITFFGMYYAEARYSYEKKSAPPIEAQILAEIQRAVDNREYITDFSTVHSDQKKILNQTICQGIGLATEEEESCKKKIEILGIDNLVISLSNLDNYVNQHLADIRTTGNKQAFSVQGFLLNDQISYFVSLKAEQYAEATLGHINTVQSDIRLYMYLCWGILLLMLLCFWLIFWYLWKTAVSKMISDIVNCFVILPGHIVMNNNRIVQYFDLKDDGYLYG